MIIQVIKRRLRKTLSGLHRKKDVPHNPRREMSMLCQIICLSVGLFYSFASQAQDNPLGQTFQISTRLNSFIGKPSWLIIVRDVNTGQVLPFLYNITTTDNFWLGLTFAHAYQVTVSELTFGPPNAVIHNFCHLQDGILDRESFSVEVSGDLTPNRRTAHCHVFKYQQLQFPTVQADEDNTSSLNTPSANATTTPIVTASPNALRALAAINASSGNSSISNALNTLGK